MDRTKVIELVLTTLVALIGLYLAHSYRRQQTLRIAELRLTAYRELWALTEDARPTRVKDVSVDKQGPLSRDEARTIYNEMTHWYFGSGNGLLLPDPTKRLYLEVKARLGRYAEGSDTADVEVGHSPADEGTRRISEIGMLRAQTRADLDIYGLPYLTGVPDPDEAELLRSAGIDPSGWLLMPWTSRVAKAVGETVRRLTVGLPPGAKRHRQHGDY